jgi:hypothetical protein
VPSVKNFRFMKIYSHNHVTSSDILSELHDQLFPHLKFLEILNLTIRNFEKHNNLDNVGISPSTSRVNFDNPDVSIWIIDI